MCVCAQKLVIYIYVCVRAIAYKSVSTEAYKHILYGGGVEGGRWEKDLHR